MVNADGAATRDGRRLRESTGRRQLEQIDLLLDAGRTAEARHRLEAGLAADPDDVQLLVRLALERRTSRDRAGANAAIARALRADPENERAHRVAAILARDRREFDVARRHAQQATRLAPHTWQTWLALAQMEVDDRRGEPQAALTAAERAVRLAPDSAEAHTVLARALIRAGGWSNGWSAHRSRRRQAADELRQAARLGATSRVAMIKVGEASWRSGHPRAAQQAFSAALRLSPGQPASLEIVRVARWRMVVLDFTVLLTALVTASISGSVRQPAGWALSALGLLVVATAAITMIGGRRPNPLAALTRRMVVTGRPRQVRNLLLGLAGASGLLAVAAAGTPLQPGATVAAWVLGYGSLLFSLLVVLSRRVRASRSAAGGRR